MSIRFKSVFYPPLAELNASAPDGFLIGIVGEEGSGATELLRLAAGQAEPASGEIEAAGPRRLLSPGDPVAPGDARLLALDHTLALADPVQRASAAMELLKARRAGVTLLMASHDETLLAWLADEIWWLDGGRLAAKGDPGEVLDAYRRRVAERIRQLGSGQTAPLVPPLRRGDGRATVLAVETLDEQGRPTMAWAAGEPAGVRVKVLYREAVENPVVGFLIRTRVGFEVYGTNTELENVRLGPCDAGAALSVLFSFRCDLCPREYTITAASHDPDGRQHEWLEDAVAVLVTDRRPAAGVANLRASVAVERIATPSVSDGAVF